MITDQEYSKLRTIIREEVEQVIDDKLEQKLDQKLKPIHKKLNKIERDLKATNHFFDNEFLGHEKRITKIEDHLHFPPQL